MGVKLLMLFGGARPNSIGAAILRKFLVNDWFVCLADKPEVFVEGSIRDNPCVFTISCDLMNMNNDIENAIDSMYRDVMLEREDLEFSGMIYAAGFNRINAVKDYRWDDFEQTMHLNVAAPFFCMQAVLNRFGVAPMYRETGRPFIYTILGSQTAYVAKTRSAPYGASKAAVNQLAACMHRELAPSGYRVNVLNFGPVLDTDMDLITQNELKHQRGWGKEEYLVQLTKNIPIKRFTTPEEIAEMAFFLQDKPNMGELFGGCNIRFDGGQQQG